MSYMACPSATQYLEDRRPSSNVDPYAATAKIFNTCLSETTPAIQEVADAFMANRKEGKTWVSK